MPLKAQNHDVTHFQEKTAGNFVQILPEIGKRPNT